MQDNGRHRHGVDIISSLVHYRQASSAVWIEFDFYLSIYFTVVNLVNIIAVHSTVDMVVYDPIKVDQQWRTEDKRGTHDKEGNDGPTG